MLASQLDAKCCINLIVHFRGFFLLLLGLGARGLSDHWGNGNSQPTLQITSQHCQAALKRKINQMMSDTELLKSDAQKILCNKQS